MSWLSGGSLALPLLLNQQHIALKRQVTDLGQALSSGTVSRPSAHLRGDLVVLSGIDSRLANLEGFSAVAKAAETEVTLVLNALETVGSVSSNTARSLVSSGGANGSAVIETGAQSARAGLDAVLSAISVQSAGRAVFSGQIPGLPPLVDADTLLAALPPVLAGATSAAEVAARITDALEDPAGLFATTLYQGGDPALGALIDTGTSLPALPTAQDPSMRRTLGGLIMASLATQPSLSRSTGERSALITHAGETLLTSAAQLAVLQGQVGTQLETLETTQTHQISERNALSLQRSTLVGADPYETAAALTERQTQLETLYALTARVSRLNLAAYLR